MTDLGRGAIAVAGALVVHAVLLIFVLLAPPPEPHPPLPAADKDKYAALRAIREQVELPEPPKEEPPPEPPKEEEPPPEPPKEEPPPEPPKEKPKKLPRRGQPKKQKREAPEPEIKAEPAPLVLENAGLTGGVNVQKGDQDIFGDPTVAANARNTRLSDVGEESDAASVTKGPPPPPKPKPKIITPKVKRRVKGIYPADAPRLGRVIIVRLRVVVARDGTVKSVRVVKGAGASFDREAERVGKMLLFSPATLEGQPVEFTISWEVAFEPET